MTSASTQASAKTSVPKVSYRHDLDGLRGLAIALVVIFHVFVGRVSGGVDVFLLLSGFFFLGSRLRNADNRARSINPLHALIRTFRRLLPALITVIAFSVAAAVLFLPRASWGDLARQVTASLLYFQNWELIAQGADYEAADVGVSPFQHLWSMSVQGQFYVGGILIVALLGWIVRRKSDTASTRMPAMVILTIATIASFIYATYLHNTDQLANYYSTWSRMWELLLGAVLALYITYIKVPDRVKNITVIVGLLLIAMTGFVIDGAQYFPGPVTLLPLGGAALVIVGGAHGKQAWASRMLATAPMQKLGKWAYALYLWHWPLLIVSEQIVADREIAFFQNNHWVLGVLVIVASLPLAAFTNRWIEEPLREKGPQAAKGAPLLQFDRNVKWNVQRTGGVALAMALVGMLALQPVWNWRVETLKNTGYDLATYPGATALLDKAPVPEGVEAVPDPTVIKELYPPVGEDACMLFSELDAPDMVRIEHIRAPESDRLGEPCVYGDVNADKTVFLMGGSHSEQWSGALDELGKAQHFKIVPVLRQGCAITIDDPFYNDPENTCVRFSRVALEYALEQKPDLVITTSTRPGEDGDVVPEGYVNFWKALDEANIPFLAVRDNPWAKRDHRGDKFYPTQCVVDTGSVEDCALDRAEHLAPVDPSDAIIGAMKNGHNLDLSDGMCTADKCLPVVGNIYVYRDRDHISDEFARTTQKYWWEKMEPVLAK